MGDTTYDNTFGISTFKREICAELGDAFWNDLIQGIELPDINSEHACQCQRMYVFMKRFEERTDAETQKKILYRVRHGLHPSQCGWAHQKFLEAADLDTFLEDALHNELNHFIELNREKKEFYGNKITDEVLEFIKAHPEMLAPVRKGNKLHCMAFPCNMEEYLKATDEKLKRYHACHCPFAKESILAEATVSPVLCNCSLGHMMNFTEGFMGRALEGRVIRSVLNGDLTCEYEIDLPEDIMQTYVAKNGQATVISNYYHYYEAFAQSGIVGLSKGSVSWIMPYSGENGPSIAFRVHLDEETAEAELKKLTAGIRKGEVPQLWHITLDAAPGNIIALMKEQGFINLSENTAPEPTMLLEKNKFTPFTAQTPVLCRRISAKEEFKLWIDIVNTALHGWEMIDAKHYLPWLESNHIRLYLAELDGIAVSACATIQNGDTGSLEFVATLEQYRRKNAAISLCSHAIRDLLQAGAETVTLGACGDSVSLYEKLGFRTCFHNILMKYNV